MFAVEIEIRTVPVVLVVRAGVRVVAAAAAKSEAPVRLFRCRRVGGLYEARHMEELQTKSWFSVNKERGQEAMKSVFTRPEELKFLKHHPLQFHSNNVRNVQHSGKIHKRT